jgi:hypothetical protein
MVLGACATTQWTPRHAAGSELTLAYQNRLLVNAGMDPLASEPRFSGLAEHVDCVPSARRHAREAERHGRVARALAITGGTLGGASLGGLGGLALLNRDPNAAAAIVGSGLAVGIVGLSLAIASRVRRIRANGHAIDAVNEYNDALGRFGQRCR